jgi:phosphate transport system permease protein
MESNMKKKLRPAEFLIEKGIAAISFLSLACIVLIFVFVFREASPVLAGARSLVAPPAAAPAAKTSADSGSASDVGASESYGDEDSKSTDSVGASETYGDDPAPEAASATDPGPSESYGDDADTASKASDTSRVAAVPAAPAAPPPPPPAKPRGEGLEWWRLLLGDWQPTSSDPKYGILPLAVGSLKVALIAILIAAPVGVLSALFTCTFAPKWAKEVMKPTIELLAGIPSVVVGFFALVILATLVQNVFGLEYRLNAFLGGIAMSLSVIPIVYTLSEDAIAAVPKSYTEGSLALGATPWETNLKVVLPAAVPGIFASILLGVGRAFGETMIVLMATGNAALLTPSLVEPVRTISASIGAEMAEVVFGDAHYTMLFLLGTLLFVFSFGLNAVAEIYVRDRLMRKFGGAT